MKWCLVALVVAVVYATTSVAGGVAVAKRETTAESVEEEEARAFTWYAKLNDEINAMKNRDAVASWNYASNITDKNQKISLDVSAELAKQFKVSICLKTVNFSSLICVIQFPRR